MSEHVKREAGQRWQWLGKPPVVLKERGKSEPTCKAPEWCGFAADSNVDERRARWLAVRPGERLPRIYGGCQIGDLQYCSPACRDARVPPLPASPAPVMNDSGTANMAYTNAVTIVVTPFKAAPAQEAPKAPPKCQTCVKPHPTVTMRVRKGGTFPQCEPCMLSIEATYPVQSGTPYAGPERLPKPRLSHVGGMHDDELVTW